MAEQTTGSGGLMDVDSKEFKDIESKLSGASQRVEAEDSKPEGHTPQVEEQTLTAKVAALEKELARVRGAKRDERDEEVVKLRERLAKMEGRLESAKSDGHKPIAEYEDTELLAFKHRWDDVLDQAREGGDSDKVKLAKANIRAIEQALLNRGKPKVESDEQTEDARKELAAIYEETLKDVPDLGDRNSELWKAAKEWHDAHPALMSRLGPLGDMMAVAKVVMKRPDLMKDVAKAARKDILSNIEKATDKAIKAGGGSPDLKGVPDFANMTTEEFEKVEHRMMAGLPLSG